MTKAKIRIPDDTELRSRLNQEYEDASQAELCKYALMLAAHILDKIDYSASDYAVKVISLLHPGCMEAVRKERLWQICHLQEIKKTKQKHTEAAENSRRI